MINGSVSSILNAHSSSVNCVELVFHTSAWGALTAGCARIVATLSNRGPLNVELGGLARDQVLCLIAARLDHQALIDGILIWCWHVSADRAGVEGLPSILLIATLSLSVRTNLHHTVDQCLIVLILLVPSSLGCASWNEVLLPLCVLLRHQTHR